MLSPLRALALALSAGLALSTAAPADALALGDRPPAFTLPTLDGKGTLSTEGCRDKRAQLVIFWSSF